MSARSDSARHLTVPVHHVDDLCVVAPAPDLNEKMKEQFERLRKRAPGLLSHQLIRGGPPQHVGLNDGLIYPGTYFPTGTTAAVAQRAALDRAPLRGTVRVVVVLVDFSDKEMAAGAEARFQELFFSSGQLTHGSVKEYFTDVSGGLISIDGEVVGPYRMPQTLATYVGADNGLQATQPNARTLANDAITAANADVNFAPYDNDGNGYVDAFIVVHAGRGAEESGSAGDIWSHKWVVPAERNVDGVKIFAYLTIPEDAKIGVSAHEIGHLIFGWPDLYDTDGTSEGIGNWCLMAGGSWGLGGDRPTHPSAWCKANQGWISIVSQTTNATVAVSDVKSSRTAYRLWKDGAGGNEYFLVENRQQDGYDASLPGEGLLIWHIDEAIGDNTNESHYKVALVQADGQRHLENNTNRGDAGDPYPGSASNAAFSSVDDAEQQVVRRRRHMCVGDEHPGDRDDDVRESRSPVPDQGAQGDQGPEGRQQGASARRSSRSGQGVQGLQGPQGRAARTSRNARSSRSSRNSRRAGSSAGTSSPTARRARAPRPRRLPEDSPGNPPTTCTEAARTTSRPDLHRSRQRSRLCWRRSPPMAARGRRRASRTGTARLLPDRSSAPTSGRSSAIRSGVPT